MSTRRRWLLAVASLLLLGAVQGCGAGSAAEDPEAPGKAVAWRKDIRAVELPGKGCFKATFPSRDWRQVQCVEPPNLPYLPANGPRPFTVGGSNDYSARVPGALSGAEGSFDFVSGVTSETGPEGGSGAGVANIYSLQLNTNLFTTSACSQSPSPNCRGWQQFVYSSTDKVIFIQYWLLNYNTTCPSEWNTYSPGSTAIDCWRDSTSGAPVARQPITNLANLRLAGGASAGGDDTVRMFVGNTTATAMSEGNILSLGSAWKDAEFIIAGDCCGSEATFNSGSTIFVRTTVHDGTTNAPTCLLQGFTAETNNLNLVSAIPESPGSSPAIISRQSNTLNSAASCQAATGIGDTHLQTFSGLFYDFQAAGDFVLAESGPDFQVQARQVSGAPTWPNASVNSAVGTRMGNTRVSVCLPGRLEVDGEPTQVKEGKPLVLPDGVDITHTGSVFLVRGPEGNSIRAQVNDGWIDVSVGLGRRPADVHGLLAGGSDKAEQLVTRDGKVLTEPLSFKELYFLYGDSWRVRSGESILCGEKVKPENPRKPFDAGDLDPEVAARARAICTDAGVKRKGTLLDACILDVAVIGDPEAAQAYVGAPAPTAVGSPP